MSYLQHCYKLHKYANTNLHAKKVGERHITEIYMLSKTKGKCAFLYYLYFGKATYINTIPLSCTLIFTHICKQ